MISDIRLQTSIRTHRKIRKLRRRLGAEGVLSLIYLWVGAAVSKPDGYLHGWDIEDIALEAEWTGKAKEFVDALTELRLLDITADGPFKLHNWDAHQAWVIGANARSEKARHAAQTRWSRPDQCSEHTPSMPAAMLKDESSNAPLLSFPLRTLTKDSCAPNGKPKSEKRVSACPHSKIIDLYHEILHELPRVSADLWKTSESEKHLRVRWKESKERQDIAWWSTFFEIVSTSDFLMGRKTDFQANLRWLVKKSNFLKVLEGNYSNRDNGGAGHSSVDCSVCQHNPKDFPCRNLFQEGFDPLTCQSFRPVGGTG